MSETTKHTMAWADEGLVGVNCYVKMEKAKGTHWLVAGKMFPSFGGALSAGNALCESCGQPLTIHWDVRITERVLTPAPTHPETERSDRNE